MISCDTNILFAACDLDSPHHAPARAFLVRHAEDDSFCLCEQTLLELYCLLRNPVVGRPALSAAQAVAVVARLRSNPSWRIVDVVPGQGIMERVWEQAGVNAFPYCRVFDLETRNQKEETNDRKEYDRDRVVARGALRDVHSLGALRGPRG